MTVIEIAVYAALLSGASPMVCHLQENGLTHCSNGYVARALAADTVRFTSGITVRHNGATLRFSNGIETRLGADGALEFSNGLAVRRDESDRYVFSNGLVCRSDLPSLVTCSRPRS